MREAALAALAKSWRRAKTESQPHACCGIARNVCCDVSALRGTVFEVAAAPPPNDAIACTS